MAELNSTLARSPGTDGAPATVTLRISDPRRTHLQVKTLLRIAERCAPMLANVLEMGETAEFDKDAVKAASDTYCLVQAQLRNLVDDQDRWALNASEGDRYLERLAEDQHQVVLDQKENLALMRRPHRRLGAKIKFFNNAGWVAWVGGDVPSPGCLHGVGASPQDAFQAFDMAFVRKVQPAPETKKTGARKPKK